MVINGLRAKYRMVRTPDGNGIRAEIQIGTDGLWSYVGGPDTVFVNETSARRAVQQHIALDWMKQVAGGKAL